MAFVLLFFLLISLSSVALLLDIWIAFRLKGRHAELWLDLAGRFLWPARLIRWVHGPGHTAIEDRPMSRAVVAARFVHWMIVVFFAALFLSLVLWE